MSNPFHPGDPAPQQPQQQPQHFSARVPEKYAKGVYCTGQIIHDTHKEFVIDFLQALNRPFQVVARVVMVPATMNEFINTFQQNLDGYVKQFGPPPPVPTPPPPERRPTIEEIYENYKVAEDIQSGQYCNNIIVGHAATEFLFDFVSGFYPNPAIAARVILPAGQAPKFLTTLRGSLAQYQARYLQQPPSQTPAQPPPPPQPGNG